VLSALTRSRPGRQSSFIDPTKRARRQIRRGIGRRHLVQQAQHPLNRLQPAPEIALSSTQHYCAPVITARPVAVAVAAVSGAAVRSPVRTVTPEGQLPVEQQVHGTTIFVTKFLRHLSPWLAGGIPIDANDRRLRIRAPFL
jgi:hypothetical protein